MKPGGGLNGVDMAKPRYWLLMLLAPWILPAETDRDLICTFVRVEAAHSAQAEKIAQAMLETWGQGAVLVPGAAEGTHELIRYLLQRVTSLSCPWVLVVPAANVYVNFPVLASLLRRLNASHPWSFTLPSKEQHHLSQVPQVVSLSYVAMCNEQSQTSAAAPCHDLDQPRALHKLVMSSALTQLVDIKGYHSFSLRNVDSCLLAVLNVRGWVHLHHIHTVVQRSEGMASCHEILKSLSSSSQKGGSAGSFVHSDPDSAVGLQNVHTPNLPGPLCMFVNVPLSRDSSTVDVDSALSMIHAVQESWATNSTVFVVPPESDEPPGLIARLSGVRVSRLPEPQSDSTNLPMFTGLRFWRHIISLAEEAGTCAWAMKVHLWTYVNSAALGQRLSCFNESKPWMLGVMTAAYSPGLDPFLFPGHIAGAILSRGSYDHAAVWSQYCLSHWSPMLDATSSADFIEDYAFALCLSDLGNMHGTNYADDSNFIIVERPSRVMELFTEVPDPVKQCLYIVGTLGGPEDVRTVHYWITWSEWHKGVPCIGESSLSKFSMGDALGNKKPYFHEEIRLAIYYCKDTGMLELERELSSKLADRNPRDGKGATDKFDNQTATAARRHLCIFVPSSARQQRFVHAAEVAWKNWGSADTYFVAPTRLSPLLDPQTIIFDLDIDTDYARLPVRTFRLFESLGQPEWVNACDWYMKADADSFVNVPLIASRLRCFDPSQYWYLGVPQIAHGQQGSTTRFASGGAGYVISRSLLPKVATWAPFCLLQQLQHSGGAGMEDVSLAGCIYKWGGINVASYLDPKTEVITSEAALNRTCVFCQPDEGAAIDVPPCTFVVHSLTPDQVSIARENIERAQKAAVTDLQCRPNAERVRKDADILVAPLEGMGFAEDAMWSIYAEPELEVLLRCSEGA